MPKQSYHIVMKTPIGERYGTMTALWENELLDGVMEILGHTEAFHGTVDEDGNCRIEGQLISLKRIIPFMAMGQISTTMLQLSLRGDRNIFEITGVSGKQDGGNEREKIL